MADRVVPRLIGKVYGTSVCGHEHIVRVRLRIRAALRLSVKAKLG